MGNKSGALPAEKAESSPNAIGFITVELQKTFWRTPAYYTDLKPIGVGAFGQVCSALDTKTNARVAIKKLSRPFQSTMHACRAYREVTILKCMNHENVIGLLDVFTPSGNISEFEEIYLVNQLMRSDLHKIILAQQLSSSQIQLVIYQILRGLKYIHSAGITHRDLKPTNVAVNENIEVRIIDFGLAREVDEEMTGYVESRWYRAPEVILHWKHYDQSVDLWSVGCILAEMMTRKPILPGVTAIDQLNLIFRLVGTPSSEYIGKLTNPDSKTYLASRPPLPHQSFRTIFGNERTDETLNLLEGLLELDPEKRLTAEQALAHPYFGVLHDENDEPIAAETYTDVQKRSNAATRVGKRLLPPLNSNTKNITIGEWKRLLFKELTEFKPNNLS